MYKVIYNRKLIKYIKYILVKNIEIKELGGKLNPINAEINSNNNPTKLMTNKIENTFVSPDLICFLEKYIKFKENEKINEHKIT